MQLKIMIFFVIVISVLLLVDGIIMIQQGNIFEGLFHVVLNTFSITVLTKILID